MQGLVFTLIGPDRPGIVDMVADCIARHDGSWEESQLVRLNGQFAGIVHALVPADQHASLRAALEQLPNLRLAVADAADQEGTASTMHLDLVGADRKGIIHQIGRVLAQRGVNLVQLESWTERAPMTGEPLFRARAEMIVPDGLSTADLGTALEALANDLMVEITFGSDETANRA